MPRHNNEKYIPSDNVKYTSFNPKSDGNLDFYLKRAAQEGSQVDSQITMRSGPEGQTFMKKVSIFIRGGFKQQPNPISEDPDVVEGKQLANIPDKVWSDNVVKELAKPAFRSKPSISSNNTTLEDVISYGDPPSEGLLRKAIDFIGKAINSGSSSEEGVENLNNAVAGYVQNGQAQYLPSTDEEVENALKHLLEEKDLPEGYQRKQLTPKDFERLEESIAVLKESGHSITTIDSIAASSNAAKWSAVRADRQGASAKSQAYLDEIGESSLSAGF